MTWSQYVTEITDDLPYYAAPSSRSSSSGGVGGRGLISGELAVKMVSYARNCGLSPRDVVERYSKGMGCQAWEGERYPVAGRGGAGCVPWGDVFLMTRDRDSWGGLKMCTTWRVMVYLM
jgi:hypothetical protein